MKQRDTNFFAYAFQLIALLLIFSYSPAEKKDKTPDGIVVAIKLPFLETVSAQTKMIPYRVQLP